MDAAFNESWFNAQHRCLGRRLHPFCLEDALILSLSESPFLLGSSPAVSYSLDDLQLAVMICSVPSEVFLHARFNRSWLQKFTSFWWNVHWRRVCAVEEALRIECQRFTTYIDDYNAPPKVWQNEDDAGDGKLGAPWVLANAVFLIRHGFKERRAWTMPLGMALWYAATLSEQLGQRIQLVSEEESEAMEALGVN